MDHLLLTDDAFSAEIRENIRSFLGADFDPQKHSSVVLQQSSQSLSEHLSQIESSISAVDNRLRAQVLEDHDQLTANVATLDALETSLSVLMASSTALQGLTESSLHRFRGLYDDYSDRLEAYAKVEILLVGRACVSSIACLIACLFLLCSLDCWLDR